MVSPPFEIDDLSLFEEGCLSDLLSSCFLTAFLGVALSLSLELLIKSSIFTLESLTSECFFFSLFFMKYSKPPLDELEFSFLLFDEAPRPEVP